MIHNQCGENMRKSIFALVAITFTLVCFIFAQNLGSIPFFGNKGGVGDNPINLGAAEVQFSAAELQAFGNVKNRVAVYNADPDFPDPENRVLGLYSMRNSSSSDYYQKSMEYLCFWEGQGANGEWEAVLSIYNVPDSTSVFVVEVSRFTWHELQVMLDGEVVADFPQVSNDTVSLGYCTFRVTL